MMNEDSREYLTEAFEVGEERYEMMRDYDEEVLAEFFGDAEEMWNRR